MGLLPLEFTDCLSDSPYFRENLHAHERELDKTSSEIKGMIKQVKELLEAAKGRWPALASSGPSLTTPRFAAVLSRAQRSLATTLSTFTFNCIGTERTDDEIVIGRCPAFPARAHLSLRSWFPQGVRQTAQHHRG